MKLILALSSALVPLGILWGGFYLGRNLTPYDWMFIPYLTTVLVLVFITTALSVTIISIELE